MKAIILTAAALLFTSGSVLAQSDHFGSDWQYPSTRTDSLPTSSAKQVRAGLGPDAPKTVYKPIGSTQEPGRLLWGQ
jgi:hypothetical protein